MTKIRRFENGIKLMWGDVEIKPVGGIDITYHPNKNERKLLKGLVGKTLKVKQNVMGIETMKIVKIE